MEQESIRAAEVVAALALGTDLGVGKPMEHSLAVCLVATGLARALELDGSTLSDVFYVSLLVMAGCTADAAEMAELLGDEVAIGRHFAAIDRAKPASMLRTLLRHAGEGKSSLQRLRLQATLLTTGMPTMMRSPTAHCEVAHGLAAQLGLGQGVQTMLLALNERWNGKGMPHRLRGDAIPLPVRITHLAFDAASFYLFAGTEAAITMARQRTGTSYDPEIVECFCRVAPGLLAELDTPSVWDALLEAEPGPKLWAEGDQVDTALEAIAHFTDLKTPFTFGHSPGVARLAERAALMARLPETDIHTVRRAALIHDLGRVAITARIWNKVGPLTEGEWESVRLHPYYTERATQRSSALAALGSLAALHHERIDGSGYHRSLPGGMLSPAARILAAADTYHAMTEQRPHREAHLPEVAAQELQREVRAGRVDGDAAKAVVTAAGHRAGTVRRARPGGLSEREIEVLRLVAQGLSNREMAQTLNISQKTVGHHVQHIYDKIDVSTRPAATLFALRHNLLPDTVAPA